VITHGHTAHELREEIDATRRELAETVEQLAHKTAIKERLRDRAEEVEDGLRRTLGRRPVEAAAIAGAAMLLLIGWNLLRSRALVT
jgi:hypothetical protein